MTMPHLIQKHRLGMFAAVAPAPGTLALLSSHSNKIFRLSSWWEHPLALLGTRIYFADLTVLVTVGPRNSRYPSACLPVYLPTCMHTQMRVGTHLRAYQLREGLTRADDQVRLTTMRVRCVPKLLKDL